MLFNGFLFAFLFARLARCEQRGAQVLFSNKAIMEVRDGKWMMHVRIYDFDASQPVVEAHVRMYCVSWRDYERQTRDLVQPHLLHHMRILQPTDELGANLFTSIPANVTHHIDAFSPLAPIRIRKRMKHLGHSGLPLREGELKDQGWDAVIIRLNVAATSSINVESYFSQSLSQKLTKQAEVGTVSSVLYAVRRLGRLIP